MHQSTSHVNTSYQEVHLTQMPISVISTEDNNNFTTIELPEADTDVNHLQEEQFSSTVCDPSSQDDSVQAFPEQNVLPDECIRQIPPGANICATLATAGLMFGATAASATSAEESRMDVWATTLSGRRDGFSTSNSALVSILGREKYLQVSRLTTHARTVSPSERCFFVLLLLVTLIYAIGILTALVLLCFHMWFLKH